MSEGAVHLEISGGVAKVTFDRPEARNAMTWAMYERLRAISAEPRPASASTSSVCSPSSGGWRRTCCGVPESFTAKPMLGTLPSTGWSISMRMPRTFACSLPKASG